MSDRGQPFRVGVVVLATMLIGALLVALNANVSLPFGQGQKTVQIQLPSAPGVDENTPVRKNGVLIGRVTKADGGDGALVVEIAPNVQVKVMRHTVSDVLTKPAPATGNDNQPAAAAGAGTLLSRFFKK